MPDNSHTRHAAASLIDEFGPDALTRTMERHDQLLDRGDLDGVLAWREIAAAVKKLAAEGAPPQG